MFRAERTTNNYVMEMGTQFTVSSERLEKHRIESASLGLQGQHAKHCETAAPNVKNLVTKDSNNFQL